MTDLHTLLAPMSETVILGNGAFPEKESVRQLLRTAKTIICCDGAVNKIATIGITPTVVVGDLDSIAIDQLERLGAIVHPDKSEEYNDMQKALKYCMANHIDNVLLIGFAGLREDHFIANVSIMANYSDRLQMTMVTDHGVFNVIHNTTTLPSIPGMQVSIFVKNEHLPLTFHRLKYPVEHRCFQHFWEASLNEALTSDFTIELHGEGCVVVYRVVER